MPFVAHYGVGVAVTVGVAGGSVGVTVTVGVSVARDGVGVTGSWQLGKKVLVTILAVCPRVTLLFGR
jgi:hypothetical protein